jgi:excisionase family DNA binding protein
MEDLWAGYENDVGLQDDDPKPSEAELESTRDDRSPHWLWERGRRIRNMTVWKHRPVEGAPPNAKLRRAKPLGPKDTKYRIIWNGRGIPALLNWLTSVGLHSPSNTNAIANVDELPYLLTPKEVAAFLRTTVGAIYARVERGQMPGVVKQGRSLRFHRDTIRRSLDRLASGRGGAR